MSIGPRTDPDENEDDRDGGWYTDATDEIEDAGGIEDAHHDNTEWDDYDDE